MTDWPAPVDFTQRGYAAVAVNWFTHPVAIGYVFVEEAYTLLEIPELPGESTAPTS